MYACITWMCGDEVHVCHMHTWIDLHVFFPLSQCVLTRNNGFIYLFYMDSFIYFICENQWIHLFADVYSLCRQAPTSLFPLSWYKCIQQCHIYHFYTPHAGTSHHPASVYRCIPTLACAYVCSYTYIHYIHIYFHIHYGNLQARTLAEHTWHTVHIIIIWTSSPSICMYMCVYIVYNDYFYYL